VQKLPLETESRLVCKSFLALLKDLPASLGGNQAKLKWKLKFVSFSKATLWRLTFGPRPLGDANESGQTV